MNDVIEAQGQDVLTKEAIDDDWWNAVYLPLPEAPTGELIERTHFVAQNCFHGAMSRALCPDGPWCNSDEPRLSAHSDKGNASQHAEAALERLFELERRWPDQLRRIADHPPIPESIEALRHELKQLALEPKVASERPDWRRDGKRSDEALNEASERADSPDNDTTSHDEADAENLPTYDFSFSRGSSGRSR